MLARIRLRKDGNGQWLRRPVDLLRFSEEDIRNRLVDTGYDYHSELIVVGFEDWDVQYNMSLEEAYLLRTVLINYYDGDEYIITHLLKKNVHIMDVILKHYRFLAKDERQAFKELIVNQGIDYFIDFMIDKGVAIDVFQSYMDSGELLNTYNGFYLLDE